MENNKNSDFSIVVTIVICAVLVSSISLYKMFGGIL